MVAKKEVKNGRTFSMQDLVLYIIIAFLGGNTSGGVLFSKSGDVDTLRRIERKMDKMSDENVKMKESIQELKLQFREFKLLDQINKLKDKNSG